MTYETITVDISDKIATITLNRPERMNACSLDMATEINNALTDLGDARCLIITGAGRGFLLGCRSTVARQHVDHRRRGQLYRAHALL